MQPDGPSFLDDLERSLTTGVAHHVRRVHRRRRIAASASAFGLVAIAVGGLVTVRDDGGDETVRSSSPPTVAAPPSAAPTSPPSTSPPSTRPPTRPDPEPEPDALSLVATTPADGAVVAGSPDQLVMTFSASITTESAVEAVCDQSPIVLPPSVRSADTRSVTVTLTSPLPAGRCSVRYRVESPASGGPVTGEYSFQVVEPTSSTVPTTSTPSTASTEPAPVTTPATTDAAPPIECAGEPRTSPDGFPVQRCSSGYDVVWVRGALEDRGEVFSDQGGPPVFTDELDAAVRRFQAANGLEVDGLVGENTWFALYPEYRQVSGFATRADFDNDGRIEPAEVEGMGDSNAICDVDPDDCPPPVTGLTVERVAVGEPLTISWTASPGAAGYRVFVSHDRSVHTTQATSIDVPTQDAPRAGVFVVFVESVPAAGGNGEQAWAEYELTYNEADCLPSGVDPSCVPR